MSHDKKKSKKVVDNAHVPAEAVRDTVKGSGDMKIGAKNTVPDMKNASKKATKAKSR